MFNHYLGFLKRLGLTLLFIPWFFAVPLVMLTGILQWLVTGKHILDIRWVNTYMEFFL